MRTLFIARSHLTAILCVLHLWAKASNPVGIFNGSFEDGLNGWELNWEGLEVYPGDYAGQPPPPEYPYPGCTVPSNTMFTYNTPVSAMAREGQRILQLDVSDDGSAVWQMPDGRTYFFVAAEALTFSQTFEAAAGASVTGRAAYWTRCPLRMPGDPVHGDASILVDGIEVWHASPLTLEPPEVTGGAQDSGWDQWIHPLTGEGEHTITIRIAQGCQDTSRASFDAITLVPEPTTLSLLSLGSLVLAIRSRRR